MEKLEMKTASVSQEKIEKIRALFPNVVTEIKKNGEVELAVDFDALKQELSDSLIEAGQERYQLTWPDKRKAVALANSAISATLRPCKEESVNFDTTENLYIEGDNLDVLKLLRETYLGKVKIIYIDPPYNTGKDSFVYNDCYSTDEETFLKAGGYYDEDGNRVVDIKANNEFYGKFHTEWLNMMYSRLKVARDLLSNDGVIFISIDDHEQANLKKLCDEIFAERNFINSFMWLHGKGKKDTWTRTLQQYILAYAKNKNSLPEWIDQVFTNYECTNPDNDPKGGWFSGSISFTENRSNPKHPNYYSIQSPTGVVWTRQWQITQEEMDALIKSGDIFWGDSPLYDSVPREKIRPSEIDVIPNNIIGEVGTTKSAESELDSILGFEKSFDYPKPVKLIKKILSFNSNAQNSIVLDFFSGSATTAHAVMQLNAEDGGKRRFICVQLPEKTDPKKEAYKVGYKNICEIGKERIRRAGKKIKAETGKTDLDLGFRVLKLTSSNMQDVFYNPAAMTQDLLSTTIDNVKPDRTPMDLLFQIMLELGVQLSAKIEEKEIGGKKYYIVNENEIIACFDDNINNDVITEIAKKQPLYAVFKDKSFATDSVGINNEQLFKTYSPSTEVKVI